MTFLLRSGRSSRPANSRNAYETFRGGPLPEYMAELGIKVRYIHSELDTFERAELLRDLRLGVFAVLVGSQPPEGRDRPAR